MKKKIVFVTPIYLPAPLFGSDNAIRIQAEELAALGHDVTIVTSNAYTPRHWYDPFFGKNIKAKRDKMNRVKIIRLPSQQFISSSLFVLDKFGRSLLPIQMRNYIQILSTGPYLGGLYQLFQKEQFDIVHCSPSPLAINQQVMDVVERLDKKPYVILTPFFHAQVESYHNDSLGSILEKADAIHAISDSEKKEIEEQFPGLRGKIITIPLYLRVGRMHSIDELKREVLKFKKKHKIENRKVVLFAGLKGSMKGALTTLAAVGNIYKRNKNIVFISIGYNTIEWNAMLKKVDTSNYLRDFGYVDEHAKEVIFASCDVFCMPSKCETFGYVYLEAWHKKKPVIGCNFGPTRELIEGNRGGVVVQFGQQSKVEKVLLQLLSNPEKRMRLGENGYKALMKKYSARALALHYQKFFRLT